MDSDIELVLEGKRKTAIVQGDCIEVMQTMPDASVDAVVTDPPAGIGFMGKSWDRFDAPGLMTMGENEQRVGGHMGATGRAHSHGLQGVLDVQGPLKTRAAFVDWLSKVMTECYRVLKPGGHALVWALPRTSHWTATAIEDAGFEIRDVVTHLQGQGFPKSLDVSKSIDKAAGKEVAAPVTDDAKRWSGWGTALKPAAEHWVLARKQIVGTVVENIQAHGTGALNIDGCRIETSENLNGGAYSDKGNRSTLPGDERTGKALGMLAPGKTAEREFVQPSGRFPSNLVLSHGSGCRSVGTKKVKTDGRGNLDGKRPGGFGDVGASKGEGTPNARVYGDADGMETVDDYECEPGCPVAELNAQSGTLTSGIPGVRRKPHETQAMSGRLGLMGRQETGFGDSGGASRFFYTAKATGEDRPFFCSDCNSAFAYVDLKEHKHGHDDNQHIVSHPTVKSMDLMRWMVRLVTPPGGVVLDCFLGSGSTAAAALIENFRCVGIEREAAYCAIARWKFQNKNPLLAYLDRKMAEDAKDGNSK